ncbi:hypothetical protein C8R42DRAFT_643037 [Lentinula raphanica]|nr:hypothetical protein C8R42DRAFT_643037 [Lentinula raphanica]
MPEFPRISGYEINILPRITEVLLREQAKPAPKLVRISSCDPAVCAHSPPFLMQKRDLRVLQDLKRDTATSSWAQNVFSEEHCMLRYKRESYCDSKKHPKLNCLLYLNMMDNFQLLNGHEMSLFVLLVAYHKLYISEEQQSQLDDIYKSKKHFEHEYSKRDQRDAKAKLAELRTMSAARSNRLEQLCTTILVDKMDRVGGPMPSDSHPMLPGCGVMSRTMSTARGKRLETSTAPAVTMDRLGAPMQSDSQPMPPGCGLMSRTMSTARGKRLETSAAPAGYHYIG